MAKEVSEIHEEDVVCVCKLVKKFPIKTVFSLKSLVDIWENKIARQDHPIRVVYDSFLREAIEQNPWLKEPICDLSMIKKNRRIIDALMLAVFPHNEMDTSIWACYLPFSHDLFYSSGQFDRIVQFSNEDYQKMMHDPKKLCKMILKAYIMILNRFYDMQVPFEFSNVYPYQDKKKHITCYYKLALDFDYQEITAVKELPVFSEEQRKDIISNLNNPDVLMKYLPPDLFEIRGFSIVKGIDVTDQELLSDIKNDLLKKDAIITKESFLAIQDKVRSLMRMADVGMGIAALNGDEVLLLNKSHSMEDQCIYYNSKHYNADHVKGSIFEKAMTQENNFMPLVIQDMLELNSKAHADLGIIEAGIRNVLIAPLVYEEELIGTFMLFSREPGVINSLNGMKLFEVYSLIALAVKRALEEFNNRIQLIIQQQFTSIHPAVEWRFRRAANKMLNQQMGGAGGELEKIIFEDVYPLYCASDIRGSSTFRNSAIQEDLTDHLSMAREIIKTAGAHKSLPVLDELLFRIDKYREDLNDGLASGDEIGIINFLRRDVEPSFRDLANFGADVKKLITKYTKTLDPEIGTLYRKRKDFDESVTLVNHTISAYLDKIQPQAQVMFPHYFDKNSTDGVDQNIYIGASLVENHSFDKLYLRNLRLWQLLVICKIARLTEQLKSKLKVPLEMTHLIVVQDMPITISFKIDEKRFAVEGAYNIRYEIMKKRIDKAVVKDTGERLTQIGKVAIVYTQVSEAVEYRQFVEYLAAKGYLEDEVEELFLEDLQGIKGLRALRMNINVSREEQEEDIQSIIEQAGSYHSS